MATLTHPVIAIHYPLTGAGMTMGVGVVMNHNLQCSSPFAGFGMIAGTLAIGPTQAVAARTVRLYERSTGLLVAQTRSASNGTYTFHNIALDRQYVAVGLDDLPIQYEADAADGLTPVPNQNPNPP